MSGSEEGFIEAGVSGRGYGFIDNSGHFAIPPVYSRADEFSNGYAHVQKDGKWLFLNKKGEEIRLSTKYEDIGHFSEGLCKVSVLKLGFMDLAYHSDNSEIAGNWGFVNEKGRKSLLLNISMPMILRMELPLSVRVSGLKIQNGTINITRDDTGLRKSSGEASIKTVKK